MNIRFCLLVLALFPASLPAQASLWTRVPALPTSCYWDSDTTFLISVSKAKEALDAEIARQEALNTAVSSTVDPSAMTATVQAAMMKDPQGAMKVMQAIHEVGTEEYQAKYAKLLKRDAEIRAQFDPIKTQFQAAFEQAEAPLRVDMQRYGDGEGSVQPTPAERKALAQKWAALYAPVCAQYFNAGALPKWLASYKAFLLTESIPFDERAFGINKDMFTFYGIDTKTYKSTVTTKAVSNYLGEVYNAYALRPHIWTVNY
jgi:hypothetical protein